ncbi:hypothetical protein [Corynebacterium maris]|uniref:hypothetical protein n=1 Tax=Corynebacterium maris TaxID=575200 RepID=UPI0012EBD1A9|nr:hypothetical protein [Corynebacterium maris]
MDTAGMDTAGMDTAKQFRNFARTVIAVFSAVLLAGVGPALAHGNENPAHPPENALDTETIVAAYNELIASDLPREHAHEGEQTVTFTLKDGVELTLPDFEAPQPYVSGGIDDNGFYIDFTPLEQDLIAGGGGVALGAAICAIPGVGWAACTVVGAIISGATVVLSHNRPCGDNWIRFHYNWAGQPQGTSCV